MVVIDQVQVQNSTHFSNGKRPNKFGGQIVRCFLGVSLVALSVFGLGCISTEEMALNETVSISLLGQDKAVVNTTYPSGFRVYLSNEETVTIQQLKIEIQVPHFIRLNATFLDPTVEVSLGDKTQGNMYSFTHSLHPGLAVTLFSFNYITLDWEDADVGSYSFRIVIQVRNEEGKIIGSNLTTDWTVWRGS